MLPSLRLGITLFPGVDSGELFTLQGSILKPGQTPELCGSQGSRVSPLGCSVSHSGAKLLVTPAAVYRFNVATGESAARRLSGGVGEAQGEVGYGSSRRVELLERTTGTPPVGCVLLEPAQAHVVRGCRV